MKLELYRHIFGKYSNSNFMKFRVMEFDFFHADGRTDGHDEA